jgi:hypothetical protein
VHNDGNEDLNEMIATIDDKKQMLGQPFNLAKGKKQTLTFTSNYKTVGKKILKVIVTAKTSSGQALQWESSSTVGVGTTQNKTPTIDTNPTPEEILSVLKRFKGITSKFYLAPTIPAKKLRNGRRSSKVPDNEHILGMIDFTLLGSAKLGLLFGSEGIYYNTYGGFIYPGEDSLSYTEFTNRVFKKDGKFTYNVSLGKGQGLSTRGAVFSNAAAKIAEILNALKDLIIKSQS